MIKTPMKALLIIGTLTACVGMLEFGVVYFVKSAQNPESTVSMMDLSTGYLAACLTIGLALFQLMLALGMPWGDYVWGGFHKGKLPASLRFGSLASFILLFFGGLSVLTLTGISSLIPLRMSEYLTGVLTIILMMSVLGNLNSQSEKERRVMIPLSIVMFGCYAYISLNYFFL